VSFELLRDGRVWLEYPDNTFYLLHTDKEVQFSQTFKQENLSRNTLHNPDQFFKRVSIKEANPADFSFNIYLIDELGLHQNKPLDLLCNYSVDPTYTLDTFNLYFVYENYSPQVYYKIENCVFTAGSFNIPRNGIITVGLSGQGQKLTRVVADLGLTPLAGYSTTPSYGISKYFEIFVGGTSPSNKLDNVIGASVELQNNISWTSNATLQDAIAVTDEQNTIFPNKFTLEGRTLGGSIQQYVDQSNTMSRNNVLTWSGATTVQVKSGLASTNTQIEILLQNNASFTNRAAFGEVFTQSYDFSLIANPLMSTVFNY